MTPFLLRLLGRILAAMPEGGLRLLANLSGDALFLLARKRRRLVLSNLSHAFPERPHQWLVAHGRQSCRRAAETALLALALPQLNERRLGTIAQPGEAFHERIAALVTSGYPIVIATPHLGAWELTAMLPLLARGKLPEVGSAYRPLKNAALDDWLRRARERFGVRMLSRREGFAEGMRILRRGGAFAVLFDQGAGDQGELSLFFDRVCSTTNLPGLLAEKFGAQLVTYYARRTGFWRYTLELAPARDAPADADGITRWLNRWLEDLLRRDDELCATWLWLHNRWKTQDVPARRLRLEHRRSLLREKDSLPQRTRFFVRLPNWLGDVVVALPLMRALRQARPDMALTAIVRAPLAPLLECTSLFEEVIALTPRGWQRWKQCWHLRRHYADCCLLFTNSLRGDLEAWLSGCPQRFGMLRPGKLRPLLTTAWHLPTKLDENHEHQLSVWTRFLRHFGLPERELDCSPLQLTNLAAPSSLPQVNVGQSWVGIIAGTENLPPKRWPIAHWRTFVTSLLDTRADVRCVLFGTVNDAAIVNDVASGFPAERVLNLAGRTSLLEFATALQSCSLVVTNDTGGMHLANAVGSPVLALFGPTNPVRTGPVFAAPVRVLQPPGCAPTGGGPIEQIAPEGVLAVTLELLGAQAASAQMQLRDGRTNSG